MVLILSYIPEDNTDNYKLLTISFSYDGLSHNLKILLDYGALNKNVFDSALVTI